MCGLDRAFNQAFQTSAMDEHMKKSLFKDKASEVEPNSKENDEEIDTNIPIEAIMEQSLYHAAEVAIANQPKVVSLKELACKSYIPDNPNKYLVSGLKWYELWFLSRLSKYCTEDMLTVLKVIRGFKIGINT